MYYLFVVIQQSGLLQTRKDTNNNNNNNNNNKSVRCRKLAHFSILKINDRRNITLNTLRIYIYIYIYIYIANSSPELHNSYSKMNYNDIRQNF